MSSQQTCVITNVDSLLGYALAYNFLERKKSEHGRLRLLCRNKQGLDKLKQLGGEIQEVDYQDENKIRQSLKNVRAVILIPENSTQRVKEAENVIKAAKEENVEYIALMSILGADRATDQQEFRHLREFHQIEQKVEQQFTGGKHCICRHAIFSQVFYFFAPMVEGQNQLRLPVKKDQKWGPVDLHDVVEGIQNLAQRHEHNAVFGPFRNANGEQRQVYQFTPRQNWNGEEITRHISEGLGRDRVQYQEVSPEDMKTYLRKMREDNRFKDRPEHREASGGRSDRPWTFPLGRYLNDQSIELMVDYWKLANQGKVDITTNDLKDAIERDPQDLREYFKNNRDQFRRLK